MIISQNDGYRQEWAAACGHPPGPEAVPGCDPGQGSGHGEKDPEEPSRRPAPPQADQSCAVPGSCLPGQGRHGLPQRGGGPGASTGSFCPIATGPM